MKKIIVLLAVFFLGQFVLEGKTVRNKYGMNLEEVSEGVYKVANARLYKKVGVDVDTLADAVKPYKPKLPSVYGFKTPKLPRENIVYKTYPDGRELHIYICRSTKQGPSPVVFYTHGGAWLKGNYKGFPKFSEVLASVYGITTVNIEYSFASVRGIKMQDTIDDCYDAVEYVLSHAADFGIDPTRIGFYGSSAGGHLAACCALHFPQTKALVGFCGAYDLPAILKPILKSGNLKYKMLVKHFRKYVNKFDKDYLESVSPYYIATAENCHFRTLAFAGTADITVPCSVTASFCERLKELGAENVEYHLYENVTHALNNSTYTNEMYFMALETFREYL